MGHCIISLHTECISPVIFIDLANSGLIARFFFSDFNHWRLGIAILFSYCLCWGILCECLRDLFCPWSIITCVTDKNVSRDILRNFLLMVLGQLFFVGWL